MHDLTNQIKQIDLTGVVREAGIELQKRRGRLLAHCPFHSDKKPSFHVYQDSTGKWRFYCFGCGIHGDALDLVQRLHGLDFKGALNHLGIRQGPLTSADKKRISESDRKRQRRQARQQRERELAYRCIYSGRLIEPDKKRGLL
jgi:DNA primase